MAKNLTIKTGSGVYKDMSAMVIKTGAGVYKNVSAAWMKTGSGIYKQVWPNAQPMDGWSGICTASTNAFGYNVTSTQLTFYIYANGNVELLAEAVGEQATLLGGTGLPGRDWINSYTTYGYWHTDAPNNGGSGATGSDYKVQVDTIAIDPTGDQYMGGWDNASDIDTDQNAPYNVGVANLVDGTRWVRSYTDIGYNASEWQMEVHFFPNTYANAVAAEAASECHTLDLTIGAYWEDMQ